MTLLSDNRTEEFISEEIMAAVEKVVDAACIDESCTEHPQTESVNVQITLPETGKAPAVLAVISVKPHRFPGGGAVGDDLARGAADGDQYRLLIDAPVDDDSAPRNGFQSSGGNGPQRLLACPRIFVVPPGGNMEFSGNRIGRGSFEAQYL